MLTLFDIKVLNVKLIMNYINYYTYWQYLWKGIL